MFHPSPRARPWSRARANARRVAGLTALAAVVALPTGPAAGHSGHDHVTDPSSVGSSVGHAAHHSASRGAMTTAATDGSGATPAVVRAASSAVPGAARPSSEHHAGPAAAPMFVVGTPERPLIARGFKGPLSTTPSGADPHGSGGERYVAARLAAARGGATSASTPVATRLALSTKQATKKLSKSCRRLVAITKPKAIKRLSKKSKRARTKCLEQRRKIIRDSKRKPSGKTPGPAAPTPATPGPTPTNPPNTGGDPSPNEPAPTPRPDGPRPAPTPTPTPRPDGPRPAPMPTPTPAPTPDPYPACTAPATSVSVTATSETVPFSLTGGCATRGAVTFTLVNNDEFDESHDLAIHAARANGTPDNSQAPVGIINGEIAAGTSESGTLTLQPGKYVLICRVEGHTAMTVKFQVV